MKILTSAETKVVSGGYLRGGQPVVQQHPRFMAMETTPLDAEANLENDATRRMASAAVTESFVPPMRFDADRMAPNGIDKDFYSRFNDKGAGV